jgi:translocation and assembly module TamA
MIRNAALLGCLLLAAPAMAGVRVDLRGVDGEPRANIEARLSLLQEADRKGLDDGMVRRLHRQAPQEIREAVQPYGFYNSEISSELKGAAPDWEATYDIQLGPQARLVKVDVRIQGEGASFEPLTRELGRLPLREQQPLRTVDYEASKSRLLQLAYSSGFLDARYLRHELRVDPAHQTAEAELLLDSGPRFFFGPVTVEQDQLDPEVVRRYINIREGDPFEPRRLLSLQFALSDLDYFNSVEIDPRREQTKDQRIPVVVHTTPRKPRRYSTGVGYGTDTGARVSAGIEFRRINDHGHKLNTNVRLSQIKNTAGAEYRIPLGVRAGESLGFSSTWTLERLKDGESRRTTVGTSLVRSPGEWQRRIYLNYEHEDFRFVDQTKRSSDLLTPGVSFNRGETDDPINSRLGWFAFVDVHGAHNTLLSTTSFLQGRLQLRGALPLDPVSRLLLRVEVGGTTVAEFDELPPSQRFFAGGDQSVRGYGYQSLGPRDGNGVVVGGNYLSTGSVEAERRIWKNWGAAVFVDAGGAEDDPWPRLFTSAGIGLRYRAPIGTVQIDLAHPLEPGYQAVRLHIGVRVGL